MTWEESGDKKRKELIALIPEKWRIPVDQFSVESERSAVKFLGKSGLLTAEELTITQLTVPELVQKIASSEYTAVQVCQAYCHRAAIAHQLVNCLVEIAFDAALKQAQELDDYLQKNGRTVGLLHGVPVSLKDQFRVKGLASSIGYVGWLGAIDEEESIMTECLRKAGAVIYVKTTVPQSLLIGETINNIMGRTLNPHNRLLACGGSTGGEGALIAFHGSPLGVGTDVGGSVRIPAAFCGIWALKPSHGRLPMGRAKKTADGQDIVSSVCGPMAHSCADLVHFMKTILQQEPWNVDSRVIELPWNETKYMTGKTGKKTFGVIAADGIFGFDGYIMPHPPILRGIQIVIDALRKNGHTVIEWQPYKHQYASGLSTKIVFSDGGAAIKRAITSSDEPPVPNIRKLVDANLPTLDLVSFWQLQTAKYNYQQEYLALWQQRSEIDAWILPVAPHAAVRHDSYKYYGYSTLINLLDWPAVAIPVTFADKEKDIKDMQYKSINELDTEVYNEYDADAYHGAPVGIQVVGKRLQEDYILGIAEQIDEALNNISPKGFSSKNTYLQPKL